MTSRERVAVTVWFATVSESDDALAEVVEPHSGKRVGKLDARDGGELRELLREFEALRKIVDRSAGHPGLGDPGLPRVRSVGGKREAQRVASEMEVGTSRSEPRGRAPIAAS